jgi:hypothetical protein
MLTQKEYVKLKLAEKTGANLSMKTYEKIDEYEKSFDIGDKITFIQTKHAGRSIELKTMTAKIVDFVGAREDLALVKYRNGRTANVHIGKLRKIDQQSELNEMVMGREEGKA